MASHANGDKCGGCRGEGAHSRRCRTQPGWFWFRLQDLAESLADEIGSNDPTSANMAYAIAARMGNRAEEQKREAMPKCTECNGDGGWHVNPDYPMGDCGDREWRKCPCGTENPARRQELWTETNRAYSIARYGSPTG